MNDLDHALEKYPVSLPGWTVVDLIRMNDHAVLYRVQDKHNKQAVIKRFNYDVAQMEDEYIHDFIELVNTVRAIGVCGLVDIYHTGLSCNAFYLLMEYLSDGTLSEILAMAPDSVSFLQKLDWFEDIVISVGTLHHAGLLHRDLKPSNIMFRDNNELVLVDCGIETGWLLKTNNLSEGEVYCTPGYVSPERAAGEACTIKAEIYSLGVMFYELIAGVKPYQSGNMLGLMKMHALAPIPTLPEEARRYQKVLNKMMAKHPDGRYDSVDDLLDDMYFA